MNTRASLEMIDKIAGDSPRAAILFEDAAYYAVDQNHGPKLLRAAKQVYVMSDDLTAKGFGGKAMAGYKELGLSGCGRADHGEVRPDHHAVGETMKTMTIQVRTGTMMNMDTNVTMKLAAAALEKGYGVRVFGYGEGVWLIKKGQDPKRFPNVGNEASEWSEKGLKIALSQYLLRGPRLEPGRRGPGWETGQPGERSDQVRGGERPDGHHREVKRWHKAYW